MDQHLTMADLISNESKADIQNAKRVTWPNQK